MKKRWLVALVLGLSFIFVYAQFSRNYTNEFLDTDSGQALLQAFGALKANYLNDVENEKVLQGAINGMLEALDDPFTYYLDPDSASRRNEDLSGSFEGIGAVLSLRNREAGKGVEILNVYRGGPAFKAGILRGDIFIRVDGVNVEEATPSEVADLVRGPQGTLVNIQMLRPGEELPMIFNIRRGKIDIISVESSILPNNVGYLSLSTFANQRLYEQMVEQLESLEKQGITSLILDLRDNGGGLLTQGVLVADEFLNSGDIVFQRNKGGTQRYASADARSFDLPMVVLVNEHSASASEIVAGALQENGRALIVGEGTFGKGVAQNVVSLPDGGQMAYVSFEWLTPKRNSIADKGIIPDIYADDTRFPNVISLEGQGVDPGQTVEIVIAGEVVGSAVADAEGEFEFITRGLRRNYSEIQGEAIVDLASDNALKIAYDTLLKGLLTVEN